MKKLGGAATGALLLPAQALAQGSASEVWSLEGFSAPESVAYDAARQVLYVSSIAGEPLERMGKASYRSCRWMATCCARTG